MKIVLDSTAYRADPVLKGTAFQVFLPALERIGADLVIPEIVFEEVVNGYRERLEKLSRAFDSLIHDARRMGIELEPVVNQIDEKEYLEDYRKNLRDIVSVLEPTPATTHVDLVQRALARRKPFNESGAGYRDALIWETIMKLLCETSGEVVFVTANLKDFWADRQLHPDLLNDLERIGVPSERLRLFQSLEDLNSVLVLPQLERLQSVFKEIEQDMWGSFRLQYWVSHELGNLIRDEDARDYLSDLSNEGARIGTPSVRDISKLILDDVRQIPGGKILVSASAKVSCEVSIDISWRDFWSSSRLREYVGDDDPFEFCSTNDFIHVEAQFALVVDPKNYKVISAQLDAIRRDGQSANFNEHSKRT